MLEQEKLNEMINLANQNGVDKATVDGILGKLSENDKKKVNEILSDKQKLNKILSSSNLKDLLDRFKNG